VDATTPQSDDLALASAPPEPALPAALLDDLCHAAQLDTLPLTRDELAVVLLGVGAHHNYGLPAGTSPSSSRRESFLRALQLPDLALAQACALGRQQAWEQFFARFRQPLAQAAIAITRSSSLGPELADALYAELYGLSERDGLRKSPLASYSGRGSLLGWLRTTLAQRHIDHHRRTHRESPLDDDDANFAATESSPTPLPAQLAALTHSLAQTVAALDEEARFLLAAYFLDQHTLQQIAQLLHVHEATISRRIKRLTTQLRERLLKNLRASGLSRRAAEEALGTDPRDLTINLRALLQTSAAPAFSIKEEAETISL